MEIPKNRKINVLQVLGKLNIGGAETLVMNIYRNIDRSKFNFDFVKHTTDKCSYDSEIIALGGKIYSIPRYKLYNHFQYKKAWNKFFQEHNNCDIVHCHVRSTACIILKIAKKYGIYTIAHSHSTSSGEGFGTNIKRIFQFKIRHIANYFLGCSKEANEWLFGKKVANSNKCKVLHNGIDIEKFAYNANARNKIRNELKIRDNEILIGHVGRFGKQKNHKFLVDVFYEYYKNINKNSKLLLIGNGELKEKIRSKIKNLDLESQVVIMSSTNSIQDYYSAMDIFVFPSLHEGLGMVVVEAQVSGLNCYLSTRVPQEVKITDNIQFISLNKNEKYWSKSIIKQDINREETYKKALNTDYDIKKVAKTLEDIYLRNNKRK